MSAGVWNAFPMSPRRVATHRSPAVDAQLRRASMDFGMVVRDRRIARGWSAAELARRADLSHEMVYRIEAGQPTSSQTAARLAVALGRHLQLALLDPKRGAADRSGQPRDVVHSAMGEFEASQLRSAWNGGRIGIGIDEPYQHFQFAGRADLVAWDVDRRRLLHVENRTRFPDFQDMAGAYNAKRAYLGAAIAERVGIRGWAAETHVIAALWSSEVLHALRLRTESFRALCPGEPAAFEAWWAGEPLAGGPVGGERTSCLIVIDPIASPRQRPFVGLDAALRARPRFRGYADAAARLGQAA
jgi:transcriptional regulator with XRE-family HTH domain